LTKCFATKSELKPIDFEEVTVKVFAIPKILKDMLFNQIYRDNNLKGDPTADSKVNKSHVVNFWEKHECIRKDVKRRIFLSLATLGKEYIVPDDLKPLFQYLLESHPGLEFLKATPEFQERYADTVVMRIFYEIDTNDDSRITWRDFKNSNLCDILFTVANEEDINKIRQYFSYEHFYVLYCRFWELDTDHDFLIDKEDFSRYEGHALSRKAVDRIFDQVPRKFKSGTKDKMSYEDFVWFMLSEEDKTTERSMQYWFSIIDLDDNKIITPHEMDYFYEEQVHRLEYLNHEPILFVDLLCQMNDVFKPPVTEGHFTPKLLRQYMTQVGVFFNCLVNLNKFIAYETRDLFAIKH
jgi:serine/threonine-protein phosphatase 2A regulatory subunit B''